MATTIDYCIKLTATVTLPLDGEQALDVAIDLLDNDRFREDFLIPAFDDPFQWAYAIDDASVKELEGYTTCEPDFTKDELAELFGVEL